MSDSGRYVQTTKRTFDAAAKNADTIIERIRVSLGRVIECEYFGSRENRLAKHDTITGAYYVWRDGEPSECIDALSELVQAVEYTPLGARGLTALAYAKSVLAKEGGR